eukprot:768195-Prorocentrum_minimum.AAC.2
MIARSTVSPAFDSRIGADKVIVFTTDSSENVGSTYDATITLILRFSSIRLIFTDNEEDMKEPNNSAPCRRRLQQNASYVSIVQPIGSAKQMGRTTWREHPRVRLGTWMKGRAEERLRSRGAGYWMGEWPWESWLLCVPFVSIPREGP